MSLKDKKSISPDLDTELVGNERGLIMLETNSKDEIVSNARRQRLSTLFEMWIVQDQLQCFGWRLETTQDASRLNINIQDRLWHKQLFITFILAGYLDLTFFYEATRMNSNQLVVPKCSQVFPIVRDLVTRTAHTFRSENVSEN